MAQFPGGTFAMYKFINDNIIYPDSCKNISGQVIVQFVVDTTGILQKPKVVRSGPCGYDQEALRMISLMNDNGGWIPGSFDGIKKKVTFTLPINFKPPVKKVQKP